MHHLDDNRVAQFAQGLLRGAELAEAEEHLDGCEACRTLVSNAMRAIADETRTDLTASLAAGASSAELPRGTLVGRYVVLNRLGSGGMGVVYAAFDPELDRKVALKVLRPDLPIDAEQGRSRLLREAQALARLSHPNLLTVYDVGALGGSVFLAIELVDGGTLKDWTRQAPRTWRAVVRTYLQAGEGLAAAHQAGLVHRDFKPSNVLVGQDGRARVTDFGLVGPVGQRPPRPSLLDIPRPAPALDTPLTEASGFLGTVQYSSPEQLDGDSADARSDQFSFCVSLYEALYGERPFAGQAPAELKHAISLGAVRAAPAGSRIPARIRKALVRGLSLDPARRFATLDALLAELGRDPLRAWRRWAIPVAVLLALAATGARWAYQRELHRRACERSASLEGVWSPEIKARAQAFYLTGGDPDAATAWAQLSKELDAYAGRWSLMQRSVCGADASEPGASTELDARRACLDKRRYELKAVVDLLARNDPAARDARSRLTRGIERLDDCLPGRKPPTVAVPSVDQQRVLQDIGKATAWLTVGKFKEGMGIATDAVAEAERLGDPGLSARALVVLGEIQEQAGDPSSAAASLHKGVVYAETAADEGTLLALHRDLLLVEGVRLANSAAGKREADQASALLQRLGGRPEQAALLALYLGDALSDWGDKKGAEAQFRKAIALETDVYGARSPEVANARMDLALNLREEGRHQEAWDEAQRALATQDRAQACRSDLAFQEKTIGLLANAAGRVEEGERHLRRALDLYQRAAEPDGQSIDAQLGLGEALAELGKYDEAARALEGVQSSPVRDDATLMESRSEQGKLDALRGDYPRALSRLTELAAAARQGPPEHAWLLEMILLDLGSAQLASGDAQAALRTLDEGREVISGLPDPDSVFLIEGEVRRSFALQELGRDAEALPHLTQALEREESALGKDAAALSLPLMGVGAHFLHAGEPKAALPLLERAAPLAAKTPGERFDLARARFLLAQALWDGGGDRKAAAALAAQAQEGFSLGPGDVRWRKDVERWRAAHRPSGAR